MTVGNINLTSGIGSSLQSLQQSSNNMEKTSNRLATGKDVNSAVDDPVAFFSALENINTASDLSARKDGVSQSLQTIQAANNGIEAIDDLMASARALAESARTISGTDTDSQAQRNELATQFNEIMNQIDAVAKDSGYAGVNLLQNETMTVPFDADGESSLSIQGYDDTTGADGKLAMTAGNNWDSVSDVEATLSSMDTALGELRTQQKALSNQVDVIAIRSDFIEDSIQNLKEGAENLTVADMNEEAANMLATQTAQQIGTAALSLTSQSAQSVLKLF